MSSRTPLTLPLRLPSSRQPGLLRRGQRVGALLRNVLRRARGIAPEYWFLLALVLLGLAYVVVLLTAPTVGRGGR